MARPVPTFLLLTLWALSQHSVANAGQNYSDEQVAGLIDEYVLHLMDCHYSPALTLAVVKDGHVVLTKGYGYTSVNESRQVTSKTKFAIASLTKAFTATAVAKWIHEQDNITFDTPIRSFYPEFHVTDDYRSSKATLRDLLSHRMGIPSYFTPLLMGFPEDVTRDKLTRLLAFMPTDQSFRDQFIYNNYMYTMAAHVLEKMSGNRKWEEILRDDFLVPLKMADSGFLEELQDYSDFALSCAIVNGSQLVDLPTELFTTVTPCGPAGSMYSNSEDMAKWMTFLLSEGLGPDGDPVVDPDVIKLTYEPGMLSGLKFEELILPDAPVSHVIQSYDMGWMTANYRGYRKIFHTGGFVTHSSRLWLFPDVKAGIYINVNGPQDNKKSLLESLMFYASDLLLQEKPWIREEDVCLGLEQLSVLQNKTSPGKQSECSRDSDECPSNPTRENAPITTDIKNFAGNYTHKCFGNIEILLDSDNSSLIFKFGRFGFMNLRRVSDLEFVGRFFGVLSYVNPPGDEGQPLKFSQNSKGVIDALFFSMDSAGSILNRFDREGATKTGNNASSIFISTLSAILIIFISFNSWCR